MRKNKAGICGIILIIILLSAGCLGISVLMFFHKDSGEIHSTTENTREEIQEKDTSTQTDISDNIHISEDIQWNTGKIPAYDGSPYVEINENKPSFSEEVLTTEAFEYYSQLDSLGRCGAAYANVGREIMPTEPRGLIGEIHPSGWQLANYHELIDGNYLYNRCHLIAFQLTGENANEKNLITGTRYLNTEGMLPFEILVGNYVRDTGNHVLYRVTPVFRGDNLLASGVIMEAMSVEDRGEAISFCIYAYNVQPGIHINYKNGDNWLEEEDGVSRSLPDQEEKTDLKEENTDPELETDTGTEKESEEYYVLNTNTHRFHRPDCDSVSDMKEKNKAISEENREELIQNGYQPCGRCNP